MFGAFLFFARIGRGQQIFFAHLTEKKVVDLRIEGVGLLRMIRDETGESAVCRFFLT